MNDESQEYQKKIISFYFKRLDNHIWLDLETGEILYVSKNNLDNAQVK